MDVQFLADCREIERLKYRYMRAVDTRDWELLRSTLEPDVVATYGTRLAFESADSLVDALQSRMRSGKITVHHLHQPEIAVDGDTATGVWALMDRVIRKAERNILDGAAIYHDEYRRGRDGTWRIARTGYERLYESEISFDDVPSFVLTADRFAQGALA